MKRLLTVAALALTSCAVPTAYTARLVARAELTLRYQRLHFVAYAAGREVAHGLRWRGLDAFVACVPDARRNAVEAARAGDRALGFSVAGGLLGGLAPVGLVGIADAQNRWAWLGSGIGAAVVGVVFAAIGRLERNAANGHAVDAINFYDDAVGSLGKSCTDVGPATARAAAR